MQGESETGTPLLLRSKDAAAILGVKVWTFNQLVKKKIIKPLPGFENRRRRFSRKEINRYAETGNSYENKDTNAS